MRTLLRLAGEDPSREGLQDTPKRVVKSYKELFAGYETDPVALLERTFEEVEGYDEIVLLRDIRIGGDLEQFVIAPQPPQQAIQNGKALGIAMQDRGLRQFDEFGRNVEGAVRRLERRRSGRFE